MSAKTTLSNAFSWMKIFVFWVEFHWSLLPRVQLIITQHYFRWWLGGQQATSHYLSQCCPVHWRICEGFGARIWVSQTGISNYIPQNCGMPLVIHIRDTCFWHQSPRICGSRGRWVNSSPASCIFVLAFIVLPCGDPAPSRPGRPVMWSDIIYI